MVFLLMRFIFLKTGVINLFVVKLKGTKGMGIYKDDRYLFPFSKLSKDQARDLVSTLDFFKCI